MSNAMQLGVIRVRGNLCQYSSRAPNKKKRGKFTTCAGKKLTPKGSKYGGHKRRTKKSGKRRGHAKKASACKKVVVSQFGNRRCRMICRKNGKISSNKPASGCGRM